MLLDAMKSQQLRFKVGDKVDCCFDQDNPYRVTLDGGVDVHAPFDDEHCIRLYSCENNACNDEIHI